MFIHWIIALPYNLSTVALEIGEAACILLKLTVSALRFSPFFRVSSIQLSLLPAQDTIKEERKPEAIGVLTRTYTVPGLRALLTITLNTKLFAIHLQDRQRLISALQTQTWLESTTQDAQNEN